MIAWLPFFAALHSATTLAAFALAFFDPLAAPPLVSAILALLALFHASLALHFVRTLRRRADRLRAADLRGASLVLRAQLVVHLDRRAVGGPRAKPTPAEAFLFRRTIHRLRF